MERVGGKWGRLKEYGESGGEMGEVKRVRREWGGKWGRLKEYGERGEMGKGGGRWAREGGDGVDEDAR